MLIIFFPLSAKASEEIILFEVEASINPLGEMLVQENISIKIEGRDIKRGIIRDLPLRWTRPDEKTFETSYEVLGVLRNNIKEPYSVEKSSQELNIIIGDPDKLLAKDIHQYKIVYKVSNHFSQFEDFDELYWNVTGNGWHFPINKIKFRLNFTDTFKADFQDLSKIPVSFKSIDVYTGSAGQKDKNAKINKDQSVESLEAMPRGHGLTVAYTWDKSILKNAPSPVEYSPLDQVLPQGKEGYFLFLIPLALLFLQVKLMWYQTKNLKKPALVPLFQAPEGISPGSARFILKRHYDDIAFASDLLNMVSKKIFSFCYAGEKVQNYKLQYSYEKAEMNPQDKKIANILFPDKDEALDLRISDQSPVKLSKKILAQANRDRKKDLFLLTPGYLSALTALAFLAPIIYTSYFYSPTDALVPVIIVAILTGIPLMLLAGIYRLISSPKGIAGIIVLAILALLASKFFISIKFFYSDLITLGLGSGHYPSGYPLLIVFMILQRAIFNALRPKYTQAGLDLLIQVKGLALYLGTAEKNRFEELYPPKEDVEHFEKLLPYALALDQGKTWAQRFARYLEKEKLEGGQFRGLGWQDISKFSGATRGASSSPSSSGSSGSGSGGGGSSGGGSGGGGGRGW